MITFRRCHNSPMITLIDDYNSGYHNFPMITLIADYISGLSPLSYDYFNSWLHFGVITTLLWLL